MLYYRDYTDKVVPVGVVLPFATDIYPYNFVECRGVYLRIDEYPKLHQAIGVMYGSSTDVEGYPLLRLPDYSGMFIRGFDPDGVADPDMNSRSSRGDGQTDGVVGSTQGDQYDSHYHIAYYVFRHGSSTNIDSKMVRYLSNSVSSNIERTMSNQSGGTGDTRPVNIRVVHAIRVV